MAATAALVLVVIVPPPGPQAGAFVDQLVLMSAPRASPSWPPMAWAPWKRFHDVHGYCGGWTRALSSPPDRTAVSPGGRANRNPTRSPVARPVTDACAACRVRVAHLRVRFTPQPRLRPELSAGRVRPRAQSGVHRTPVRLPAWHRVGRVHRRNSARGGGSALTSAPVPRRGSGGVALDELDGEGGRGGGSAVGEVDEHARHLAPHRLSGWRTVVSGGSASAARGTSSKPTTAMSSGTRTRRSRIARSAPTAVRSLAAKRASSGTPASSSWAIAR